MNEQLIQLYGYLHGMWRYRWSALVIAWIVALFGWVLVLAMPNKYTVNTVVYVDTSSVLKPLLKGLTPETDSRDELQIMTRILLSRDNLMSVIRETDMDLEVTSPEEKEGLLEYLAEAIKIEGGESKKQWEARSNVYEISYQSHSAKRSYQVVSNLLNTMIEDTLNSTRTDTAAAQKFLESQISIYEKRLSLAEENLAKFKRDNVGYMPDEKGGYYMRLQRAKDEVKEIASALRLAERRYTELSGQLAGENPLLGNVDSESENAKKIKEYQAELDSLLQNFTHRHPKVKTLQAAIADLKAKPDIGRVSPNYTSYSEAMKEFNPVYQELQIELSKTGVEIEILKIQLKEKNAYVNKLRESIEVIPEVEAKLAKLNRDYEVTRARYLDLVERREAAMLAQSAGQSSSDVTFRIIEPPRMPLKPSGPDRAKLLIVVLVAALGAGFAWSYLRYFLQPTFIDSTQLVSAIGLPVLGSVNLFLTPVHIKRRRMQLSVFVSAIFLLVLLFGAVFLLRNSGVALIASVIR